MRALAPQIGRPSHGKAVFLLVGDYVSWSLTVNDVATREDLPVDRQELLASLHSAYPRDAYFALQLAQAVGLKSAVLAGGRTPNPYGGDEIVDIAVRGTPVYNDFLLEMREIISAGPGDNSVLALHWEALARLREKPCSHVFGKLESGEQQCAGCGVILNGTMFRFEP